MRFRSLWMAAILVFSTLAAGPPKSTRVKKTRKAPPRLDPEAVNNPNTAAAASPKAESAAILRAQVLLDRANFSAGEINAAQSDSFKKAISAFQASHGLATNGMTGPEVWAILNEDSAPALLSYTISPDDVAGPFAKIPDDMMEKAKLPALNYESALEGLAEKFHSSPELLIRLNPGRIFEKAGADILVPNVITAPLAKAASLVVLKSDRSIAALDDTGKVLAYYPATIGSDHDPLPLGTWKITSIKKDPEFNYNPQLFWDADPAHAKAKLPPGPNSPVGVVWIGISKEHYGIHGSSEPSSVGRTQSHGCIRLTNWDAAELAKMVAPGMNAEMRE